MKLSKKITILISVIFIIIFAIIASRYFVGKHFEKKFSQRPPPGVIVEIVDNSEFFEKIETFGTAVALKTKNYRIKKEQIEDQKIKFGKIIKRGEIVVIIDNEKIIAPFKGILGKREIAQGVLGTDSFILTLDDISSVMLDIKVPESYLSILKAGLDVNIKSDSYQKKFKGIIESVSSRVDPNTRSVLCNIKVSNPNLELIPGMLLNAEIIYNKVQAIGVSESSILVQGKTNFVYKVLEDNSVEKMEVEVGKRSFGKVMVLNGLNINDKIIKEGISKVRNKMKVKIVN
jgi:membrane fusion protein (multidrug efflux system)